MIVSDQWVPILEKLLEKSRAGEVRWEKGDPIIDGNTIRGREFNLRLDDAFVTFGYYRPVAEPDYVLVNLCDSIGMVEDQWKVSAGEKYWDLAVNLCREGSRTTTKSAAILSSLAKAIETPGPIGYRNADAFLRKVAGEWRLSYDRGGRTQNVNVRIDEDGKYYFMNQPEEVAFVLDNIEYDSESGKASFTKIHQRPPMEGRQRQTEILSINPDGSLMEGIAAHDGHRLVYRRLQMARKEPRSQTSEAAAV